jgi:hypothetical protein
VQSAVRPTAHEVIGVLARALRARRKSDLPHCGVLLDDRDLLLVEFP